MRSKKTQAWAVLVGLTLLLFALDQITKWLVVQNLAVGEAWAPIPALAKVFTVTHVQNTGVGFGQLPGWGWLFMVVNIVVIIGIPIFYSRIPEGHWLLRLALALIIAGALGNVIDRLRRAFAFAEETGSLWTALPMAYVTDFMDFKIWPVWNVADLCAVSGAIILAVVLWRSEAEKVSGDAVANDQP